MRDRNRTSLPLEADPRHPRGRPASRSGGACPAGSGSTAGTAGTRPSAPLGTPPGTPLGMAHALRRLRGRRDRLASRSGGACPAGSGSARSRARAEGSARLPVAAGRARPRRGRDRGFGAADAILGAFLGGLVLLAGLSLVRGAVRLGDRVSRLEEGEAGARWALDVAARYLARAGIGVCPDADPDCPDEAIELLETGAIAARADLDRDDRLAALDPERWLAGRFRAVPTANDEVFVFLRRNRSGRGRGRVLFEADLVSDDRVTRPDGTEIARRDGVVEAIDGGPYALPEEASAGTFYLVRFVDDARRFGTAWFRSMQPLADGALQFQVVALDAAGAPLPPCGGADDAASRACRARVRRVRLELALSGMERPLVREVALPRRGRP